MSSLSRRHDHRGCQGDDSGLTYCADLKFPPGGSQGNPAQRPGPGFESSLGEAENVPEGTVVNVEVHSESVATVIVPSSALTGTDELRTATASVAVRPGFSSVTLRASFGSP
jgi:hypothetical protein